MYKQDHEDDQNTIVGEIEEYLQGQEERQKQCGNAEGRLTTKGYRKPKIGKKRKKMWKSYVKEKVRGGWGVLC